MSVDLKRRESYAKAVAALSARTVLLLLGCSAGAATCVWERKASQERALERL